MKKDIQYRWSIKTDNVYAFCGLDYATTLASYKNEVSGVIRKSNLHKLIGSLIPFGYSFKDKNIRLLRTDTYMRNWNKYNP